MTSIESAASPRFLSQAAGPELVKEYFRRVMSRGRLAHAYLFSGPAGAELRSFAIALAQALLCETGEPCGLCPSCRAAAGGNHPALTVFSSADQKASLDIAEVRNLIQRDRFSRPGLMVWIIEEVERLSLPATNALLKILEEPNPGALLILLSPSAGSLLPTIVSRCHRILFPEPAAIRDEAPGIPAASGSDPPAPEELLRQLAQPSFFAEWDPREWLAATFPGSAVPRQSVGRILDWSLERCRRGWLDWERGQTVAARPDPLPSLEELVQLRALLDANINADLIFEALVQHLRKNWTP